MDYRSIQRSPDAEEPSMPITVGHSKRASVTSNQLRSSKSILSYSISPQMHITRSSNNSGSKSTSRSDSRASAQSGEQVYSSSHDVGSAPLLVDPRYSSYSYSLPRSLDTGIYSDSMGGSPLLYGDSFVDHQNLQAPYQDNQQPQLFDALLPSTPRTSGTSHFSIRTHQTETRASPAHRHSTNSLQTHHHISSCSHRSLLSQAGKSPSSVSQERLVSSRADGSRSHIAQEQQDTDLSQTSPNSSVSRGSSVGIQDTTHGSGTLIMPQIMAAVDDQVEQTYEEHYQCQPQKALLDTDFGNRRRILSDASSSLQPSTTSPLLHRSQPRMMSASQVPLHTRLSRLQKKARRGIRGVDMETNGQSQLYDEFMDSTCDFSSRRHSVAEEDVCYPPGPTTLEIDYTALEEYIRKERIEGQDSKMTARTLTRKNNRARAILDEAYRFTLYSTASVTVHAQSLDEIAPRKQTLSSMLQAGYFWLDVLSPTEEEIRLLSQVFKIHPLTTEDILMEEGREKCEMFLNYYFVCFRTFAVDPNSPQHLQGLSIYILVFPNGILTYHFRPVTHCRNVRRRIRHLKERIDVTPDWINYAVIDDIVDSFAPLLRQVETEVDLIDELVLILKEIEQPDMLRRIGNCRKRVMSLLRLLTGKADVIKGLIKRYEGKMGHQGTGEIGLFMGDIQDHIITMLQNLSHYERILSRSHYNYLAHINIEMTSASNETNNVLTKLTVLGSIVLPMNLVTGLWGMNVPVPGQQSVGVLWFFSIVMAIVCAASLFFVIARKTRLL
ncbi:CorA metal ion transporter [Mortierella sp. GBA30]|nr:CorA metal ion transporter [Mortierella sp. GBA30]